MKPPVLADRTVEQLAAYSLTALAAVLAGSQTSYSQSVIPPGQVDIDVDGDSDNDLHFTAQSGFSGGFSFYALGVNGLLNLQAPYGYQSLIAANFAYGQTIDGTAGSWEHHPANPIAQWVRNQNTSAITRSRPFMSANGGLRGFLPIRLQSPEGFHYGWVDYEANDDASQGTIHGWAVQPVANLGIGAGVSPVPEPAQTATALGLLALGAAGVRRYRQQRAQEA